MKTDSDRPSLTLGYVLDSGGYTNVSIRSVSGDRILYPLSDTLSRRDLIEFVVSTLKRHDPRSFAVRVGDGPVLPISRKTVEDIRSGRQKADDFIIGGADGWKNNRGQ